MLTVYFVLLGIWLRTHRSKENTERSSRVAHFFFFAGLVAPPLAANFYPSRTRFYVLIGLPSLPFKPLMIALARFLFYGCHQQTSAANIQAWLALCRVI